MTIALRHYGNAGGYQLVSEFLIRHYQPENRDGNWIEPAWEYMHSHSMLDKGSLGRIGLWEDEGKLVAVTHYEWSLGEAFFQFHPSYRHLKQVLLDYAEENLFGFRKDGTKYLHAYINDCDPSFMELVRQRGYQKDPQNARPIAIYPIPEPFPSITLPSGYRLTSMAENCDWEKIHRVLWRGFDHPGEPPVEDLEERKHMADSPNFKPDLKIMVEAPDREFVSFSGAWYQPDHHYAYIEPVATDPDYRRMGLGRAAVLECIRRCALLGAKVAFVGNDLEFYLSMGFKVLYTSECWLKTLD